MSYESRYLVPFRNPKSMENDSTSALVRKTLKMIKNTQFFEATTKISEFGSEEAVHVTSSVIVITLNS